MNSSQPIMSRAVTGNRWQPLLSIIALHARAYQRHRGNLVTIGYRLPTDVAPFDGVSA